MAASHHATMFIFKFKKSYQLIGSGGSKCIVVPNVVIIDQVVAEISQFFLFFQDGG